ncbi:MAG: aldo/keto reductase [Geodermatophilaceae bacterium]|nr:aldo/keto reductase [Geodermatophilaceae bacterium]
MQTRRLGEGGPLVGAIGLGCMGMSWAYGEADEQTAFAVLHRALDLGVTLFDTAQVYGPFANEELVGHALTGRRDDLVLATKTGLLADADRAVSRDGRPEHVRGSLTDSLRRLRTDRVDLYYLHRVDEKVPIEETWAAMAECVADGTTLHLGLSEVTVEQAATCHAIHPVSAIQSELSLWTRGPLDEVVPWCAENGAAFVPFSPLGRGFLTGALAAGSFEPTDFRAGLPRFTEEAMAANETLVAQVRAVAESVGLTPAQVALAWTLAQGEHVIPIPGTKRVAYLEENVAAADVTLDAEQLAALDALPEPVGERY